LVAGFVGKGNKEPRDHRETKTKFTEIYRGLNVYIKCFAYKEFLSQ
jgi:hypothetical protein